MRGVGRGAQSFTYSCISLQYTFLFSHHLSAVSAVSKQGAQVDKSGFLLASLVIHFRVFLRISSEFLGYSVKARSLQSVRLCISFRFLPLHSHFSLSIFLSLSLLHPGLHSWSNVGYCLSAFRNYLCTRPR